MDGDISTRSKTALLRARYGDDAIPTAGSWNATLDLLLAHRSVRSYLPKPLPDGALETMVAAAQSASTSSNLQNCSAVQGVPLLANMTEFGRPPFFIAEEFAAMGNSMVIWPMSGLRVANNAQADLYAAIACDGGTHRMTDRMQTHADLYETIGLRRFEALDTAIVQTIIPTGMPQRH
jgi:Nitroreductase family